MRILFIGDIVGKPGRDIVCATVNGLKAELNLDLVIANAENAAGGSGLTPAIYRELIRAGLDGITLGDHVYRRKEIYTVLETEPNIVKPANLPADSVGREWTVIQTKDGVSVAIACFLGQLFMRPIDSPWRAADRVLSQMPADVRIRLIDFHAEATSEMQLMGRYLDGRVTAVLGTHTHVPTADECIFPSGTAFQCDVGMTGPFHSIIGRRIDRVMETTLTGLPTEFDVATGDVRLCGTIISVDTETGKATAIERICVTEADLPRLSAAASS
ncbi:MAG TPA: TIGR00282 family metallophosphoesterase [Lacipirellulaceae bacterium]|nr:TIGR00282 family metallophosphoesterase [Lacipirellulaceae bacterium]